jgi:hypothetical protein
MDNLVLIAVLDLLSSGAWATTVFITTPRRHSMFLGLGSGL